MLLDTFCFTGGSKRHVELELGAGDASECGGMIDFVLCCCNSKGGFWDAKI